MIGAPALAALGALRAGAGLARLVMPRPVLDAGLVLCPSATGWALPVDEHGDLVAHGAVEAFDRVRRESDAVVIGPGMGDGPGVEAVCLRAVQDEERPVIVDADAINALSRIPELARDLRASAVLTPHPGEFRRLAGVLSIREDPAEERARERAAGELARRLGCVVVLKGAGTVVSDGYRSWVCARGHACLATAGTGDVLAGVIGGLAAQWCRGDEKGRMSLFDAARVGVEAHASAGEAWAAREGASAGLLAMELAGLMPPCLEALRGAGRA